MYIRNSFVNALLWHNSLIEFLFLVQSEEFQHTAYSTNAYVTIGPLAKQVLQGNAFIYKAGHVSYLDHQITFLELDRVLLSTVCIYL